MLNREIPILLICKFYIMHDLIIQLKICLTHHFFLINSIIWNYFIIIIKIRPIPVCGRIVVGQLGSSLHISGLKTLKVFIHMQCVLAGPIPLQVKLQVMSFTLKARLAHGYLAVVSAIILSFYILLSQPYHTLHSVNNYTEWVLSLE